MESPAPPPDENQGGRRLVSGTPQSGTPSLLWPDLRRPRMGGTKGGSAPAPSPGPTLRQGTKATFTAGGGRGGVYAGAELQNSWLGTESTEEKGTIPVALQGPEAGWTVAPSPTLTVPQGAWAAQVGRRSGWPGMPAQAPSLSRRWQERPLPQPCKAPRTINPPVSMMILSTRRKLRGPLGL